MPANKYSRISCVIYLFFVAIIAELFPIIRDIRYILIPILALPIIWHLYTTKKKLFKNELCTTFLPYDRVMRVFIGHFHRFDDGEKCMELGICQGNTIYDFTNVNGLDVACFFK